MKKLLMLLILLGMAGGAGYIYWEKQAKRIDANIADGVARFNAEVKAQTGVVPLEYKQISISGFPFSITLNIVDPVIRLPLSRWARDANPNKQWVEEHRFQGNLTLSADWKVTKYTLRLPKQRESVTFINGKPYFPRKSTSLTQPSCSLSLDLLESFDKLWQPAVMLKNLMQDASLLKALECNVQGYDLVANDAKGEKYHTVQNFQLSLAIDKEKQSDVLKSFLDFTAAKIQAYPLSDAYYAAMQEALPAIIPYTRYREFGLQAMAFLGEQNLSMKADYKGASALPSWGADGQLSVQRFELNNSLGNASAVFTASNQPQSGNGNIRELALSGKAHATFAPMFEALMQRRLATDLYTRPMLLGYNVFFLDTGALPRNLMPALAADLYPKLNTLSPFDVSGTAKATIIPPHAGSSIPQRLDATIDTLELQSAAWKMKAKGVAHYNPLELLPTLDASVYIQDGDAVFAQAADKLITLEKWRQQQTNRPAIFITNEFIADLRRMVDALAKGQQENMASEVATLGDPQFHLEFKNFMPSVNGLNLNQIMLLVNELLSSHLPTANPAPYAAPTPPATYQPATPMPRYQQRH